MLLLFLLAQMSAPESPNQRSWFGPEDTPIRLMPENIAQQVRVALTISPDGKLLACEVEASSNRKLNDHTCSILKRRAKFKPAVDNNGNHVYGVFRTVIGWWVGDSYPPEWPDSADIEVNVASLPPKVKSPHVAYLQLAVDEDGRVSDCSAASNDKSNSALVKIGCERLVALYRPKPAKSVDGAFVPSIQTAAVLFKKD